MKKQTKLDQWAENKKIRLFISSAIFLLLLGSAIFLGIKLNK